LSVTGYGFECAGCGSTLIFAVRSPLAPFCLTCVMNYAIKQSITDMDAAADELRAKLRTTPAAIPAAVEGCLGRTGAATASPPDAAGHGGGNEHSHASRETSGPAAGTVSAAGTAHRGRMATHPEHAPARLPRTDIQKLESIAMELNKLEKAVTATIMEIDPTAAGIVDPRALACAATKIEEAQLWYARALKHI
jgi:hypothetical protein